MTLLPLGIYHVFQHVYINRSQDIVSPAARKQLLLLMGLLFLVSSAGWWLDRFGLLLQRDGAVWGIGYGDLHARVPAFWAMYVVSIGVALALFSSIGQPTMRRPVTALGGYFLARLLLVSAWPGVVQEYSVKPNELGMEEAFLYHNIDATRSAYALDRMIMFAAKEGWVPGADDILGIYDGVGFTVTEADLTLELANTVDPEYLDIDLKLDARAVRSIVEARPIETIDQLSRLYYVGYSALNAMKVDTSNEQY